MAKTLAQLQSKVAFNARDDSVSLITATNLEVVNETYRELVSLYPWPEFLFRSILTDTTVIDQELYDWTGAAFSTYLDIKSVEIESLSHDPDTVDDDVFNTSTITSAVSRLTWKNIPLAPNELEWDLAGRRKAVTTPLFFKRNNDKSTNQLALRPAPSVAGYRLRVVGIGEPTALTSVSSVTGFLMSLADDALAHLIAAVLSKRDGMTDAEQWNKGKAASILQSIFGKDPVTEEGA